MLKLTYEEVLNEFNKCDYILLEDKYINTTTKMKYVCKKHPSKKMQISMKHLRRGVRCKYCSIEKRARNQTLSFSFVKEQFEKYGYEVIDEEYFGAHQPIKFRCPVHKDKILKTTYIKISKGRGCKYCSREKFANNRKNNYKYVENYFIKLNYKLLDNFYTNNHTKMNFICFKHPLEIQQTTFNSLTSGKLGCKLCSRDRISGSNNHGWKGGVTELSEFLRKKLYNWKLAVLELNNFVCFISGVNDGTLEIHHATPFNVIRDRVLKQLNIPLKEKISDYNDEELLIISTEFVKAHENIQGVPMTKKLHELFHKKYGHDEDVGFEDVLTFKMEYLNGSLSDEITKKAG
ncbi:hypothetical protein [Paenibacillus oleatilyticus]|uniref:hypothetical protein n=1 Tax=Paenibacillus oleatilyticus TaxID=2594886 RepID=UPI001C1F386E|nr:hypothetical protein [Paenibacillus oleatilyticus]MBU7316170.1 hypothetical protein [Paenibacillus oleatilyticus]